jgi:hypothetical protein
MTRTRPGRRVFPPVRALGAEMGKQPLDRVNYQRFISVPTVMLQLTGRTVPRTGNL